MKRSRALCIALPTLLLAVLMTSCGQTYHLQSIVITPISTSIETLNGYANYTVSAHLSNGETRDITTKTTFTLSAPVDISSGGQAYMLSQMKVRQGTTNQIQAVGQVCTWSWVKNIDSTYSYASDSFTVTATFEGQTAQSLLDVNTQDLCFDPNKPAPAGTASGSGLPQ